MCFLVIYFDLAVGIAQAYHMADDGQDFEDDFYPEEYASAAGAGPGMQSAAAVRESQMRQLVDADGKEFNAKVGSVLRAREANH